MQLGQSSASGGMDAAVIRQSANGRLVEFAKQTPSLKTSMDAGFKAVDTASNNRVSLEKAVLRSPFSVLRSNLK